MKINSKKQISKKYKIFIGYLVGEEPSEDLKAEISKIVNNGVSHDVKLHHLHSHKY